MFKIRPFNASDEDYVRIIEIHNTLWPDELDTIENKKYEDQERNPQYFYQRLMIELDDPSAPIEEQGKVIGLIWCDDEPWNYEPGKYAFGFEVDPGYSHLEYGQNSISQAVIVYLLDLLNKRDPKPKLLKTFWREDKMERIDFLKTQGFTQEMRIQDSELDITTFDPSPSLDKIQQVKDAGIEILSVRELKLRYEDWMHRLYDLDMETLKDLPSTSEFTPQPIEEYAKEFNHPSFLEDGWLVALDEGICVGVSDVWHNKADPQKLSTGYTGVRRSHRRKGVATALKLAVIAYAQQRGATHIITGNEENNPMYQLNVQLGFQPKPALLEFHKKLM